MPRQNAVSSETVIAAQRAYGRHIPQTLSDYSSPRALQTVTLLHPGADEDPHSPQYPVSQQPYSTKLIDYRLSQRCASSSTVSRISDIHNILATSTSIALLETQTSVRSDGSSPASNRSGLLCVRDFPTKDTPLPGWQFHVVEDQADSFEPIQEPDRYLHTRRLRRSAKEKALSWKAIIKVRSSNNLCLADSADLVHRS